MIGGGYSDASYEESFYETKGELALLVEKLEMAHDEE